MVDRSPNFPSMPLGDAVDAIKKVHGAEGRSKVPRLSVVKPLGYTSINGRSLSVLGALKAYGLIEGRSDDLRISQEGFFLANAPADSIEYREALLACFRAPAAFQQFAEEDEGASAETLKWKLQKAGFQADSAERLVRVYRESRELVNAAKGAYEPEQSDEQEPEEPATPPPMAESLRPQARGEQGKASAPLGFAPMELGMGVQERVLQSGMLSKSASFRVIVSGNVGVAEIERLVKKLEMDKEILADDPVPPMLASGGPDPEGDAAYEQWQQSAPR